MQHCKCDKDDTMLTNWKAFNGKCTKCELEHDENYSYPYVGKNINNLCGCGNFWLYSGKFCTKCKTKLDIEIEEFYEYLETVGFGYLRKSYCGIDARVLIYLFCNRAKLMNQQIDPISWRYFVLYSDNIKLSRHAKYKTLSEYDCNKRH